MIPAREPAQGYASLVPSDVLGRLHTVSDLSRLGNHPDLARAIGRTPVPRPRPAAVAPLFNGTIVFVQVTFRTSSGSLSIPSPDLATSMNFARMAAPPISRYASQYGPNAVAVSPNPVSFPADVPDGRYNDQTLQGWINQIATTNGLAPNTCVAILNPAGAVNTDADPKQGIGGYHSLSQVPYLFVNVMGTGLTLDDRANVYALALSHEIAEMVVDPKADLANPEICDPCGPNCQTVWLDYFDPTGKYLGTSQNFPPAFAYAFFINGIVKPASSTLCPAPGSACNYAPP